MGSFRFNEYLAKARQYIYDFFEPLFDGLKNSPANTVTISKQNLAILIGLGLLAIWMTIWNFSLPGFQLDEANHIALIPGILHEEALRLHHYRLPDNMLDRSYQYPILGGSFYNTTVKTYVGLPFFPLFGFSLESARFFMAAVWMGAIASGALFIYRVFGRLPAILFALLILTDPTSVFSARSHSSGFWFVILFTTAAMHLLLTARRTSRPSWLLAFMSGVMISFSVLVYFVGAFTAVPLIIAGFVIFWRKPAYLAAFIAGGAIGYSPQIYGVLSVYLLYPDMLRNFGMPEFALTHTYPVFSLHNLERSLDRVAGAFSNFSFARGLAGDTEGPWFAWIRSAIFLIALVATIMQAVRAGHPDKRAFFRLMLVGFVVYLVMTFFLKATEVHHLFLLLFIALMTLAALWQNKGAAKAALIAAAGLLLATNIAGLVSSHRRMVETGGADFNNIAYGLPALIHRHELRDYIPVFAMWGLHLQYLFLTEGQSQYEFTGLTTEAIQRQVARYERIALYVPHNAPVDVEQTGASLVERRVYTQRDGQPLYDILLLARLPEDTPDQ